MGIKGVGFLEQCSSGLRMLLMRYGSRLTRHRFEGSLLLKHANGLLEHGRLLLLSVSGHHGSDEMLLVSVSPAIHPHLGSHLMHGSSIARHGCIYLLPGSSVLSLPYPLIGPATVGLDPSLLLQPKTTSVYIIV